MLGERRRLASLDSLRRSLSIEGIGKSALHLSCLDNDCFVFDARVSVGHGLREGPHQLCYACRRPILPADRNRSEYEHGVACHKCDLETAQDDKKRFRERQKQILLSRQRGEQHMVGFDGS